MNESESWLLFKKVPPITLLPVPNMHGFLEHHKQKSHRLPCEILPVRVKEILVKSNADNHNCWRKLWKKAVARSPQLRINRFSRLESGATQNSFPGNSRKNKERNTVSTDVNRSLAAYEGNISFERRCRRSRQRDQFDQYQFEKFPESSNLKECSFRNQFPVFHSSSSSNYAMDSITNFFDEHCSLLSLIEDRACIAEFAQLEIKQGKAKVVYKQASSLNRRARRENIELLGAQASGENLFATAWNDSERSLLPGHGLVSKAA